MQRDINANIRYIIYQWEIKHNIKSVYYTIYNDPYTYVSRSVKIWGYNYSKDINEHVCSELIKLGYNCNIHTSRFCTNKYQLNYIKNSSIKKEKTYDILYRLIISASNETKVE